MVKKSYTRKNLSNKVYQNLGFSKNLCSNLVDDFFEGMIISLTKYNFIKITSFGTFKVMNKKERIGRNPKTKEIAKISARKVVKFKPSIQFKNRLNNF